MHETQFYLFIGSKGHLNRGEQTFNGGGRPHILANKESHGASGGGSTDIRFEANDLYHRVLVAGGGGGTDDNQAAGGSGGYEDAQGYWISSSYNTKPIHARTLFLVFLTKFLQILQVFIQTTLKLNIYT